MTLIQCSHCHNQISDTALLCPECGYSNKPLMMGYNYKSTKTLFGLPLVHIAIGPSYGGQLQVAKGIIAIGNVAVGGITLGGISFGLISLGGISLGLIAALGGFAASIGIALGGFAAGYVAIGGFAIGTHILSGNAQSPELLEFFKSFTNN